MPVSQPDTDAPAEILRGAKTIAVVGLSADPEKDSQVIARYLRDQGYRVIGVSPNPKLRAVWPDSVARLSEIREPVDIVNLFLRSEAVAPVVDEAIAAGAKAIWMQIGVTNEAAGAKAEKAGLKVVMNTCIRTAHSLHVRSRAGQPSSHV
ncbi:MAG: CoA-binding protein [Nitrospirae bacterium]|nr:CoA-binding protein [Nitrospirota bacterium]